MDSFHTANSFTKGSKCTYVHFFVQCYILFIWKSFEENLQTLYSTILYKCWKDYCQLYCTAPSFHSSSLTLIYEYVLKSTITSAITLLNWNSHLNYKILMFDFIPTQLVFKMKTSFRNTTTGSTNFDKQASYRNST